jgi:hypothetical protein
VREVSQRDLVKHIEAVEAACVALRRVIGVPKEGEKDEAAPRR